MRSEKHVAQGVENRTKIVIANAKNDESTTVDNDVQFERPPAGVGFQTNLTCMAGRGIGFAKMILHPTTWPIDVRAGPI